MANPYPFGSAKYDQWQYEHPEAPNGTEQALADAKGTIASSGRFLDSVAPPEEGPADTNNGFLTEQGSVFDSPLDRLARLGRQIVRPIPGAIEGAAGVGSFLPGPVGMASRAVTGAKSGYDLLSGGTEGLTEHPIGSAMDVAGVAAGLSSLKGLKALMGGASKASELADMVGGRALAYERGVPIYQDMLKGGPAAKRPAMAAMQKMASSDAIPPGGYHAQDLLENPGAQTFMQREFNTNKPVADKVFGRNVDLMGNPKQPPFTSAWEQARQQASMPLEADLTAELDALANKPRPAMSALGKLMERPAFEGLPQGPVAAPKAAPRPSRARPVATAEKSTSKGKSPQQLLNEEALAARRKK